MTSINMGVNTGLISMQCYSSAVSSSNFQSAVDFFFIYCQNLGMSQKYFWSCSWNKVGSGGLVYYLHCSAVVLVRAGKTYFGKAQILKYEPPPLQNTSLPGICGTCHTSV